MVRETRRLQRGLQRGSATSGVARGVDGDRKVGYSSNPGKVISRHEKNNKFDSRVDARVKLMSQNKPDLRAKLIDARDVIRQNSKSNKASSSSRPSNGNPRENIDSRNTQRNIRKSSDRQGAVSRNSRGTEGRNIRGENSRNSRGTSRGSYTNVPERTRDVEKRHISPTYYPSNRSTGRNKEPLMIVTGLGSARRKSNDSHRSFKETNTRRGDNSRDHYVKNNGSKTLITLKNDKYNESRDRNNRERRRSRSRSKEQKPIISSGKNSIYEPIKIKINNSNYVPQEEPEDDDIILVNDFSKNQNQDQNDDDSMEYDCEEISSSIDYDVSNTKYMGTNILPINNDNNNAPSNILNHNPNLYAQPPPSLLPNPTLNNSLNSVNGYNSSLNAFKPPSGLIVNNFSTGGMYSSNFDRMWNPAGTNFFDTNKSRIGHNNNVQLQSNPTPPPQPVKQQPVPISKDGYKLLVSNLHPKVTEDDVLELFSDIGPIKRARFIDKGLAEVIYVRIEHAKEAITKYDLKELDGRQMVIGFADKAHSTQSEGIVFPKYTDIPKDIPKIDVTTRPPPPMQLQSTIGQNSLFPQHQQQHQQLQLNQANQNILSQVNRINNDNNQSSMRGNLGGFFIQASNTLSQTTPNTMRSNSLSNRFKSKERSSISIPESKHIDKTQSVNHVDASIITQVLFHKKTTNSNPVTFTVKL